MNRILAFGIGMTVLAGLSGCKHDLRKLENPPADGALPDASLPEVGLPVGDAAMPDAVGVDAPAADTGASFDVQPDVPVVPECPTGQHMCPGGCVPNDDPRTCGTACTPCDSPLDGTATCDGTQCGGSCPAGSKLCHGACIDEAAACSGACPATQHACGGLCPLLTDPKACGSSCLPCPVPAGATQASCDGTKCDFQCTTGTHKCGAACADDGDATACGATCATCPTDPNGVAQCVGGQCGIACKMGFHLCGDRCVSNTDVKTCGATSCAPCQVPAGGTATCDGTACLAGCPSGMKLCAGSCIAMSASCSGMCPGGTHDCSGICASNTSVDSCGTSSCSACAKPAGASTTTCDGTKCDFACGSGYHRCGARCAPDTDATGCGTACVTCPTDVNGTAACVAGACSLACKSGFHVCNGKCVDNKAVATCGPNDNTSCTACTVPTGGTVTCDGLACVPACPSTGNTKLCAGACIPATMACNGMCPSGSHNCNGTCQPDASTAFCGASCKSCPAPTANGSATCSNGNCAISCSANYRNCPSTALCVLTTAMGGCCSAADCTSGPANSVATCTAGNTCSYPCNSPTYKQCGNACILASACCGACMTGYACTNGQCPTSCSDNTQCASTHVCRGGQCQLDVNVCGFKMPNSSGVGLPNPAAYDTSVAGVVTDTVSGLVWERAVSASTYTQATAATYCASNRVDGKSDWRLPTVLELVSIVDVTAENGAVTINQTAFPSTPIAEYITSTPVAGASTAWRVNFQNGNTLQGSVTAASKVRCVRTGSTPAPRCAMSRVRYNVQTAAGVTTVSDALTGLTWRQDAGDLREWTQAESYCAGLSGGFRQPTVKEMLTIMDFGVASPPLIDPVVFPGTVPFYFWTSSPLSGVPTSAWLVDFSTGVSTWNGRTANYYVRCVK